MDDLQKAIRAIVEHAGDAAFDNGLHGNAQNSVIRDAILKQAMLDKGYDPVEVDAAIAKWQGTRRVNRTRKAYQRATANVLKGSSQTGPKGKRLTKAGAQALREASVLHGIKIGFEHSRKRQSDLRAITGFVDNAALIKPVFDALKSQRQIAALAKLIRSPEWRQEASRIVDEIRDGTLEKDGFPVATLKRLEKRAGAKGNAAAARELEKIARQLTDIRQRLDRDGDLYRLSAAADYANEMAEHLRSRRDI